MKILNNRIINYYKFRPGNRHFSRSSRKRVTTTHSALTDEEINAKIKELQMLKSRNLQTVQTPSVWSRIVDGVLHGLGWSFASRMVDSIFGPRSFNITSSQSDNNPVDHQDSVSNSEGLTNNLSENFSEDFSNSFTDDSDSGGQGWSWITEKLFDDE